MRKKIRNKAIFRALLHFQRLSSLAFSMPYFSSPQRTVLEFNTPELLQYILRNQRRLVDWLLGQVYCDQSTPFFKSYSTLLCFVFSPNRMRKLIKSLKSGRSLCIHDFFWKCNVVGCKLRRFLEDIKSNLYKKS